MYYLLNWLSVTDTGKKINDILNNAYKEEGADTLGDVRAAVTGLSQSAIRLTISLCLAVLTIAFLITALKIGTGNPVQRGEAKRKLAIIFFALAGLSALSAIVLFIVNLSSEVIA